MDILEVSGSLTTQGLTLPTVPQAVCLPTGSPVVLFYCSLSATLVLGTVLECLEVTSNLFNA